ncbi:MAG: ABC transporter permease subunit [Anaerohalosphaera sp.]|nr:ABC transporter permease subunit [Anaerohalosphaera sp.]
MLTKVIIIAKNTFVETIRQPIYAVILSLAIFLFVLSPSISMYTLDEDIKMLRELGLSTLFLAGLFIAIFSASSAVTEEIDSKTITTVLSKPIGRPTFIIGKFFGVMAAVGLAHYILTIAYLMIVRHGVLESASDTHDWTVILAASVVISLAILLSAFFNYSYDWSFNSSAIITIALLSTIAIVFLFFIDRDWKYNPHDNHFEMFDINASILLLMAISILVSLAVLFSTRCNVVLTLTICVGFFMLGLISDFIFSKFIGSDSIIIAGFVAKAWRILVPNLQAFWISDAIYEGSTVPASYIGTTALYAVGYTTGILSLAIALFQRRQVG